MQNLDSKDKNALPNKNIDNNFKEEKKPFALKLGCRFIGCFGCLIFFGVIFILAIIFISKPAFIWSPIVDFLNNGIQIKNSSNSSYEEIKKNVNNQIQKVGISDIAVTEDELTAFGREVLPSLENLTFDIESDSIRIYWIIEKSIPDKPLYATIWLGFNENKELLLKKAGTERINTPEFLNKAIVNIIFTYLNSRIQNPGKANISFIGRLISPNENLTFDDLKLEKDRMILTINLKANLL